MPQKLETPVISGELRVGRRFIFLFVPFYTAGVFFFLFFFFPLLFCWSVFSHVFIFSWNWGFSLDLHLSLRHYDYTSVALSIASKLQGHQLLAPHFPKWPFETLASPGSLTVFKILQWLSTAQTRKQHIQSCKLTLISSPTLLPSTQSSCFNLSLLPKDNGLLPPPRPHVLLLLSHTLSTTPNSMTQRPPPRKGMLSIQPDMFWNYNAKIQILTIPLCVPYMASVSTLVK